MITQVDTQAQIYLQNQRGKFQTKEFRSFYTLNFGDYNAENREPFGNILTWNDETLLPQCRHSIIVEEPTRIILLPLVGAIEIDEGKKVKYVDSGESLSLLVTPDNGFEITNPYPDKVINYLQIRVLANDQFAEEKTLIAFDLNRNNQLLPILNDIPDQTKLLIGKYDGREEGVYYSKNPSGNVFVFIIEGAFEVQNRLLERRDGLSLKGAVEVEFEALSNEAILLIMESAG